jgi:hypothetical protein
MDSETAQILENCEARLRVAQPLVSRGQARAKQAFSDAQTLGVPQVRRGVRSAVWWGTVAALLPGLHAQKPRRRGSTRSTGIALSFEERRRHAEILRALRRLAGANRRKAAARSYSNAERRSDSAFKYRSPSERPLSSVFWSGPRSRRVMSPSYDSSV